jgi:peroxiredoxin Q/BCP
VSDAIPKLGKLNVAAVGISPDKPPAQKKFDEKYELGFPLLSDLDREVARKYGALGLKTIRGQKKEGIIRSSFLIDEKGKVLGAWYKVKPEDTIPKALEALG